MILRPYQSEAVAAVYRYLREHGDNPCVVIPTAGGKTPIIATICRDAVQRWGGRVVILAHVKELLTQAADKLRDIAPDLPIGIYSAGLKSRDLEYAVTVAGIQSIYKRAAELGKIDLALIDEAHLIQLEGDGMYRQFIADAKIVNPKLRIIGFTATPWRTKGGGICGPDYFLNEICYEATVRELVVGGYICRPRSKQGTVRPDFSGLHIQAGEFVNSEAEALMDDDALVESACAEIIAETQNRRSVLIFAQGVRHGQHVAATLNRLGVECGFLCGDTPDIERAALLARFQSRELKYLANVNVLTTGFDATGIDCVVALRATASAGLFYQMVGRGFRLLPGLIDGIDSAEARLARIAASDKPDCLILDFGGNVLRHGPVDMLKAPRAAGEFNNQEGEAPAKECPQCRAMIAAGYGVCPECSFVFPPPERSKHEASASDAGVMSDEVKQLTFDVMDTFYAVHQKRGADDDAPKTLRVDYRISLREVVSEWVCVEHAGFAYQKAEKWWNARTDQPMPATAAEAVAIAKTFPAVTRITVERTPGDKFDRVIGWEFGERPEPKPEEIEVEGEGPDYAIEDKCPTCGGSDTLGLSKEEHEEVPSMWCQKCGVFIRPATMEEYERATLAAGSPF